MASVAADSAMIMVTSRQKKHAMFVFCLLVFLFSLQAKISLYSDPPQANPVNSSKLWQETHTVEKVVSTTWLLCVAAAFFFGALLLESSPTPTFAGEELSPRLTSFEIYRFLRPPPLA